MALTQTQVKLTALFAVVEKKVQTHYLDRFTNSNPEFLSENETINVKDLNDFLVEAGIIERGSEIPYIKVNGIDTTSITPDIIAASYPLKPVMPTSTVTMINGKEVSAQDFEEDRMLAKLKNAILKTKEKTAANIFLQGKYLQKESGTLIDFKYDAAEEIDAKTVENWVMFFFKLIDDYEEKNGIYPDRIELGRKLFEKIIKNNEFLEIATRCLTTEIFLTSVNAASEKGEMVNIDGTGNRVAGSLFGHEKVYFIFGTNKIAPTLDDAIWRARNIAAPQNSKKYNLRTPCVIRGDKCYDCASPDRICNTLNIYLKKMNDIDDVEIIIIDENLGF